MKSHEDKVRDRVLRIVGLIGLEEMRGMTDSQLLQMPNFGKKALAMFRAMHSRRSTGYYGQMHIHASYNFPCPA